MTADETRVCEAAMEWWRMKRPVKWTKAQHLKHPTVNCVGNDERILANAIGQLILNEQRIRYGGPHD